MCSNGHGDEAQSKAAVDKRKNKSLTSLPRILGPNTGPRGNGHPKPKRFARLVFVGR